MLKMGILEKNYYYDVNINSKVFPKLGKSY